MAAFEIHPALNAGLNATTSILLLVGFASIRKGLIPRHRACMIGAFTASSLFLISYVIRWLTSGTHVYPGDGWDKILYLLILFSHMVLAVALLPLALTTLNFGLRDRRARHRRIARWTLPIWLYVSVTGVAVYVMLYHLGPRLAG